MVHKLKILPEFFIAVETGVKNFEIRKNDRDFKIGDEVELCEYNGFSYTGRIIKVIIIYLTDYDQKEGNVVFGFTVSGKEKNDD